MYRIEIRTHIHGDENTSLYRSYIIINIEQAEILRQIFKDEINTFWIWIWASDLWGGYPYETI